MIFWFLLVLSLPGFGQGGSVTIMRAEPAPTVETIPAAQGDRSHVHVMRDHTTTPTPTQTPTPNPAPTETPSQTTSEATPAATTQVSNPEASDEAVLEELENERAQNAKVMDKVNPEKTFEPFAELEKLGHHEINLKTLLDERANPIFERMLKENQIRKMPKEQVKELIMKQLAGKPLEDVMSKCPYCLNVFADLARDEKALPGLLHVFARKEDLKTYGVIWLVLFIILLVWKGRLYRAKKDERSYGRRLFNSLTINLSFTALTFYIFYQMFEYEIGPLVRILGQNL